jgi:hypothetical protein
MRSDNYEQEVEFDRLCDSLTGKGSDELVMRLHAEHSQIGGGSKQIHLHAVSELAAQYADHFYSANDFNAHRYWILSCRLAGMLHEAMEWGATFEDITSVADETVARLVASITPDRRLPRPKRLELYSNQVGLAPAPAQLIKLADLQHECFRLCGLNLDKKKDPTLKIINEWLDEARLVVRSIATIRESTELEDQISEFHVKLSELDDNLYTALKKRQKKGKR